MAATNVQAFPGDVTISSNLAVDTNTLFVDSVGNNVGIGTTNPVGVNGGRCLEGSSSTGFEYIATRDDTAAVADDFVGAYLFKNTDTDGVEPHYAGMSSKMTGGNGPMDLRFHTNRDQYESDTPQMIINSAGYVGIGTNAPVSSLHVFKATGAAISVESSTAGTYGSIEMGGPQGAFLDFKSPFSDDYDSRIQYNVDSGPNGQLLFTGSNVAFDTNTLFIDSVNDRVGIGMTNPAQKLHVSKLTSGGVTSLLVSNPNGSVNASAALKLGVSSEDNNVAKFGIIHERKSTYGGGDTYFCTNYATDTTEVSESDMAMTILGSNKNVGIGTNVPKQPLEVKTYAVVSGRLGVGSVLTSAQNAGGQDIWNLGTAAKLVVRCLNNSDTTASYANARAYAGIALVPGFDAADTTNMGLWGGGSGENPKFYIQNQINNGGNGGNAILLQPVAGSVGIGVFTPAHLLDVAGYIGCTGLDMAGTQIRTGGNQAITAGTYVQVATYRTLASSSTYLITVTWNGYGSGASQQLWHGGASWMSSVIGGANSIYAPWDSSQAVVATQSYHYRSIGSFSFKERGTGTVTGNYMDHGIQMTNSQSSNTVTDLKAVARWIGPWAGG